ncbi:MAG: tRNA (adenosine(37)-N6)-threonylcarbamoyltransferase complex dimerization subunit type 1 TsaB [Dermatophilaceae bacterium]
MLLLAIDTATSAITVALHDGRSMLAESSTLDSRRHGEYVAPAMAEVLDRAGRSPADVTAVVSGTGPGPFTGLRVGLVTARTFAFARGIPVFGVCSLDALAHQAWLEDEAGLGQSFVVATDARRKEVYWARYDLTARGAVRRELPMVAKAGGIAADVLGLPVVGRGALLYPESFGLRIGPLDVSAGALADLACRRMAAGEQLTAPEPMYLRRPDAVPQPARKAARP